MESNALSVLRKDLIAFYYDNFTQAESLSSILAMAEPY